MARWFDWTSKAVRGHLIKVGGVCDNVIIVRFDDVCGGQCWLRRRLLDIGLNLDPNKLEMPVNANQKVKKPDPTSTYTTASVFERDSAFLKYGMSLAMMRKAMEPANAWRSLLLYIGCGEFTSARKEVNVKWLDRVQPFLPDLGYPGGDSPCMYLHLPQTWYETVFDIIVEELESEDLGYVLDAHTIRPWRGEISVREERQPSRMH